MRNFFRFLLRIFLKIIFRIDIKGFENIPKTGRCIVSPNHLSNFDAVILWAFIDRPVYWMAKAELFKVPLLKSIVKWAGAFPVERDKLDLASVRTAIGILKSERVLGIFSEGTRAFKVEKTEAKSGVILFAEKTLSPVIPVRIISNFRLGSKVFIRILEPVYYDGKADKADYHSMAQELLKKIMSVGVD